MKHMCYTLEHTTGSYDGSTCLTQAVRPHQHTFPSDRLQNGQKKMEFVKKFFGLGGVEKVCRE